MVTTRGKTSRGTSAGSSAARAGLSNAEAVATRKMSPYRIGRSTSPARVVATSVNPAANGTVCARSMIRRRS